MKRPSAVLKKAPNKEKSPNQTISFRIDQDKLDALEALAKKKGVNRTALIQLAIAELLERGL